MSAINVLVQSKAVHFLTDGAGYDADRTFLMRGPKILPVPHLSCAISVRGPASARPILCELLSHVGTSYNELRSSAAEAVREACKFYAPVFAQCSTGSDLEEVVGGFTDEGLPDAYMVASHSRYGSEPWMVTPIEGLTFLPNDQKLHARVVASLPAGATPDDLDFAKVGLAIMELQRSNPEASSEGDNKCAIGAFAQMTTITVDGIQTKIIHRWPDVIGERVAA